MKIIKHKAFRPFMLLLSVSLLLGYVCFYFAYPKAYLFPKSNSPFQWRLDASNDAALGGDSTIKVDDEQVSIDFRYKRSHKANVSGAGIALNFEQGEKQPYVDLSRFSKITFVIKCTPKNTLFFGPAVFDEKVSVIGDLLSYRGAGTLFKCNEQWAPVSIDLRRLEVQLWWLQMFKLDSADREYNMQKVLRISVASSFENEYEKEFRVQITEIKLEGMRDHIIYIYFIALLICWIIFLTWYFKLAAREIEARASTKKQFVGYQQLTLEPHRDKEKSSILLYLSTHYADPEIDIESISKELGISRSKINEILKAEVGHTFTVYLNKLRITEAARLLTDKSDANITEIVYKVGYKNISYFNKLFKEEFSCTPKAYKLKAKGQPISKLDAEDSDDE